MNPNSSPNKKSKIVPPDSEYILQLAKNLSLMPKKVPKEARRRSAVAIIFYHEVCNDLNLEYEAYKVEHARDHPFPQRAELLDQYQKFLFLKYIYNKYDFRNPDATFKSPYHKRQSRAKILFIERATVKGDRFSGQIGFPGGKQEEIDRNDKETAIRETFEEIGVDLHNTREFFHLGELDDLATSYTLGSAKPIMSISPQIFIRLGDVHGVRPENVTSEASPDYEAQLDQIDRDYRNRISDSLLISREVNTVNFVHFDSVLEYVTLPGYNIPPNPLQRLIRLFQANFTKTFPFLNPFKTPQTYRFSNSSIFNGCKFNPNLPGSKMSKVVFKPQKIISTMFHSSLKDPKLKRGPPPRLVTLLSESPGNKGLDELISLDQPISLHKTKLPHSHIPVKPKITWSEFIFGKYYYYCIPLKVAYRFPETIIEKHHPTDKNIFMSSGSDTESTISNSNSYHECSETALAKVPELGKFASTNYIFLWGLSLTMLNNTVDYALIYDPSYRYYPSPNYVGIAGHWPLLDQRRWFDVNSMLLIAQRSFLFGYGGSRFTRKPLYPLSTRDSFANYYPCLATALITGIATRSAVLYYIAKISLGCIK
ncbi:hypothetical protein BB560_003719, partial [Smittium megazygosporum]